LSNAHHIRDKSSYGASLALNALNSDRDRGYGSDDSDNSVSRISQSYGAYLFDANYKSKVANNALRPRLAPQSSDYYSDHLDEDEPFMEEQAEEKANVRSASVTQTSDADKHKAMLRAFGLRQQTVQSTTATTEAISVVRTQATSLTAFSGYNGHMHNMAPLQSPKSGMEQQFIVEEVKTNVHDADDTDVGDDDDDDDQVHRHENKHQKSPSLHRDGFTALQTRGDDMKQMMAEVVLLQQNGDCTTDDDHEDGKDDEKESIAVAVTPKQESIDVILSDAWSRDHSINSHGNGNSKKPISTTPFHAHPRMCSGSGTQNTLSFARRSVILEDNDDDEDDNEHEEDADDYKHDDDDDDVLLVYDGQHADDAYKAYNSLNAHSSEDDDAHDIGAVMQHDVMRPMRTFINGVKRKSKKSKTKTKTKTKTKPHHSTSISSVESGSSFLSPKQEPIQPPHLAYHSFASVSGTLDEEDLKLNEVDDEGDLTSDNEVRTCTTNRHKTHDRQRAQHRRILLLQNINASLKQTIQNQAQQITHLQTEKLGLEQQCDRYKSMVQQPNNNDLSEDESPMDALRRQVLSLQEELNVTKHKLLQYEIFDENSEVDIHALLNDAGHDDDDDDTEASDEHGDGDGDEKEHHTVPTTCTWLELEKYIIAGNITYVEKLMKVRGVSMHDTDEINCYRMLECATRHNQLEIVHKIISSHMGVKLGNKLLCYRHDKNYAGYTILMIAVTHGYLEVANDLLDYYEYHSLSYTNDKIFEYLNLTDRNGVTLLMKACQIGSTQIISWVLNQYFGHKIQLKTLIEAKDAAGDDFHAYIQSQAMENIINEYSPLIKG